MVIFNKKGETYGKILSARTLANGNFKKEVLDEQLALIATAQKQKGIRAKTTKFLLASKHAIEARKVDSGDAVSETVTMTAADVKKQVDAGIAAGLKAMQKQMAASVPATPSTPTVPTAPIVPEVPINYEIATLADLKVLATSKGLTFGGKITKVEIVELLKNAAE